MLRSRRVRPPRNAAEEQFHALVRDHAEAIYRVAFSVVRDQHLAEDIVQETIIKAWQNVDSWRGEGSQKGWLLSIAHNTAVSALRRVRDYSTAPEHLPEAADTNSVERSSEARADLDRLRDALATLDDLSRSIVIMRDLDAMTYQQIADALGISLSNVKTRLLRARRELQRIVHAGATT